MVHFKDGKDIDRLVDLYSNKRFTNTLGNISEKDAKMFLVDFMRYNIAFTVEFIFGIKLFPYQVFFIKQWFENNFCMNVWSRGGAKTIYYTDSQMLIDQKNGLVSIVNLIKNIDFSKGERWEDIPGINLWNGHDYASVNKVLIQPNKPCLKLSTSMGYTLEGSENHLIKVLNNKGHHCNIIWKRYHELRNGDYVCIDRNSVNYGEDVTKQEEKNAYLIGLSLGENDAPISDIYESFIVSTNEKNPHDKKIPESILKNKRLLKECLRGLWITSGHVNAKGAGINPLSEKLSKQVQDSLLTFGITCHRNLIKTRSDFEKIYEIIIKTPEVNLFYDNFGLSTQNKQSKLKNSTDEIGEVNTDTIPGLVECINDIKKNIHLNEENLDWDKDLNSLSFSEGSATYTHLNLYINKLEKVGCVDSKLKDLKEIQKNNFLFDKIVSLEKFNGDCIDFNIPDGEMYWCNGFINHNSYTFSIFSLLYPIFYPSSRIALTSNVFRSSRRLLEQCEKFINATGGTLLAQCYPNEIRRGTDLWSLKTSNEGFIRALPLNEKIRGERADILGIDEFLLVPESTYAQVLLPFLNARNDIQEQMIIQDQEDILIRQGVIKEEDRTILDSNKKIIALTSASYDFEYCYQVYNGWIKKAMGDFGNDKEANKKAKYFVSRVSYLAIPEELVEQDVVNEAKAGGENSPYFQREYMALFHKGSDGFFSMKHMSECTYLDGEEPCVQMLGDKNSEYVLSIDPSFSSGKVSDFFAMGLFLIDKPNKRITLVNSYSIPGGQLKDHISYFYFLIKNFNIVLIIGDFLGGVEGNFNFIEAANQSHLFKDADIHLKAFDGELHNDGEEYIEGMKQMRKTYNLPSYSICYRQKFTSQWIKRSNEYMQFQIQNKKVWFASRIVPNEEQFSRFVEYELPISIYDAKGKRLTTAEYLDEQDYLIQETKNQIALIEPKSTPNGTITFDLPSSIKAIKGEKRARRDNYTTTLMACWGAKMYFDYLEEKIGKKEQWKPFFVR